MKTLSLILIGALIIGMPSVASAFSLSVSAQVTSGTSLGTHTLIACNGYNYDRNGDPWTQAACYAKTTGGTSLTFGGKNGSGPLVTKLYDTSGTETVGADCFYAANFYIVYLFPDAWGGAGYQVSQSAAILPSAIQKAVVFTPVYSSDDQFCWGDPPTCAAQGALTATEQTLNPQLNVSKLAKDGGLILKAYRARIVRAEYGIPPKPDVGETRPTGWEAIPLTTTSGTYAATLNITLTQI